MQSKKKLPEKEDDNYTPPIPPANEKKKDDVKACASKLAHTEVISMCLIPVKIKYNDSNALNNTFAMLDHYSQECFVNSSLLKNLTIKGHITSY